MKKTDDKVTKRLRDIPNIYADRTESAQVSARRYMEGWEEAKVAVRCGSAPDMRAGLGLTIKQFAQLLEVSEQTASYLCCFMRELTFAQELLLVHAVDFARKQGYVSDKNKHFKKLMAFLHGDEDADPRIDEVKGLLKELINGEFSGEISQHKISIVFFENSRTFSDVRAKGDRIILRLNANNWNEDGESVALKSILRHELLHISTGLDDDDPKFKAEARKRKIDIWNV